MFLLYYLWSNPPPTEFDQTPSRAVMQYIRAVRLTGETNLTGRVWSWLHRSPADVVNVASNNGSILLGLTGIHMVYKRRSNTGRLGDNFMKIVTTH